MEVQGRCQNVGGVVTKHMDTERRSLLWLWAAFSTIAGALATAGSWRVARQLSGPIHELELHASDYVWILGLLASIPLVVFLAAWITNNEWEREEPDRFPAFLGAVWVCTYVELVAAVALVVIVALLG